MEKKGTIGDIELTELTIKTVTPLLHIFRPAWDISAVKVKVFSEGSFSALSIKRDNNISTACPSTKNVKLEG